MTRKQATGAGFGVLVLVVLSVLAPSDADDRPDPADFAQAADAAYDAGNFKRAAGGYRIAFSLYDPVDPAHQDRRVVIATKRSRALVLWTRALGPDEELAAGVGAAAERWIRIALHLDPSAGWPHLDRAMLFDADWAPVKDPIRAKSAYRAFVAWVESGDHADEPNQPDVDGPLVREARERLASLERGPG